MYRPIALNNSQFRIQRGGYSSPNGTSTPLNGRRASNPVVSKSKTISVNADFSGYRPVPIRSSMADEVVDYVPIDRRNERASISDISVGDVNASAGASGSSAPGVLEFGASASASTESGVWTENTNSTTIDQQQLQIQETLYSLESQMGDGGDEILTTKRNKFENIGAVFNDYPSIKIDPKGRSQPLEMLVSEKGIYKNHDYIPHVEEVDNSSNFPCGNDIKVVGNSLKRTVGSGGIHLKTTGALELGGTTVKIGGDKVSINSSQGVHIGSENSVELQSLKTIVLRTNRQVYVESSLGVRGNTMIGGGLAVEGEVYLHHVTAPVEIQQTEDTVVYGKFNTLTDRELIIGECNFGGEWYPVYAFSSDDILKTYPHSHHFKNIPLRLKNSNADVRKDAMANGINKHGAIAQATGQIDERK